MKLKVVSILSFLFSSWILVQGQNFSGHIKYLMSDGNNSSIDYYVNANYIKKVSGDYSKLERAGFTELVWDLKSKTKYYINSKSKSILKYDYSNDSIAVKSNFSNSEVIVDTFRCFIQTTLRKNSVNLSGQQQNLIEETQWFFNSSFRIGSSVFQDKRFDNLDLSLGYFPLSGIYKEVNLNSLKVDFQSTVIATNVDRNLIADDFFKLPEGFEIRDYDENEIRESIRFVD